MKRTIRQFISSTSTRLAATYLLIIMVMSIGFSIVFYNTSSRALNRQIPPNDNMFRGATPQVAGDPPNTAVRDFLNERAAQGRRDLTTQLIGLNLIALVAGAGVSYILARRALRPIEDAMESQRQFVSDASHELRTPLTAIQTSNDVALRNKKLTLAQAKEVIQGNTEEAGKLKQLSDGLLNLAKNDQHVQPLKAVALSDALQGALTSVVTIAQQKDIAVDDSTDNLQVLSSLGALQQIIVILLDNAVKYSPAGSTIYLTTTTKGGAVQLHVRDEGVGIRASDLPHLFRRFYRADSSRTNGDTNGYGLGLAIADSLAQANDARLSVTSELHKGSTFTLTLRAAP